jgi:cytochrome c-type biogenesis protein CcmH/NrfG
MQRKQIGLIAASLAAAAVVYVGFTRLGLSRLPAGSPDNSSSSTGMETPDPAAGSNPHEWQMLQQQLEKKPGHVPILLRMAQIAAERGEPSEAARLLRQAVEQEPQNLDARLELGRALYESGDVASAISETEEILKTDPNHVDALYNLGAIYANTNNVESATRFWQRAVASDPDSDSGHKAEIGLKHLTGAITNAAAPPAALSAEEDARLRDVLTNVASQK